VNQFIRFALIGVVNTLIHYGVFMLLYAIGLFHLLASVTGFLCAVTNSFIMNKRWTFKTQGTSRKQEFTKFFLVNLVSLGVNVVSMLVFIEVLNVAPPLAQLLTIGLTLVVNFTGTKYWVFKRDNA
jgi:putative flippase GtrA